MAAATLMSPSVALQPETPNVLAKDIKTEQSSFLVQQIAKVLASIGYDDSAVNKGSARAATNIVEASIDVTSMSGINSDNINSFLNHTLDGDKLRQKGIYLNSNEPVLLLEVPDSADLDVESIQQLKNDIRASLTIRGIRPVRVYIRNTDGDSFGFCLLNVVNTDIGSPSMVQLLDAAFHDAEWKDMLLSKEAWNGDELIWRDENWAKPVATVPSETPAYFAAEKAVDPEPNVEGHLASQTSDEEVLEVVEETSVPTQPAHHRDIHTAPDEDEGEDEAEASEHPAWKELREREALRAAILHPTWARDDEGHLLDIITTQSSGVKDEEPLSVIGGKTDSTDDDFEIVDKS